MSAAAEAGAPRPTSEGLFGSRRDHGTLWAGCDAPTRRRILCQASYYMFTVRV